MVPIAHRRRRSAVADPPPSPPPRNREPTAVRIRRGPSRSEAGQVVPVVAVAMLLAGLIGLGVARLAATSADRSAAQAAADAAALAGAARGPDAARRVAAANGARVVAYREHGVDVVVEVVRQGHRARARARWTPTVATPPRPGPEPLGP